MADLWDVHGLACVPALAAEYPATPAGVVTSTGLHVAHTACMRTLLQLRLLLFCRLYLLRHAQLTILTENQFKSYLPSTKLESGHPLLPIGGSDQR